MKILEWKSFLVRDIIIEKNRSIFTDMKLFKPNYYDKFTCIAHKCKHSCCVGWEIDIDDDTAKYYKSINGKLGERLSDNIVIDGNSMHFKLSSNERCPFLNEDNLCDIILELGEDCLSQICTDHPRFRNFFECCTEIGVGLCCEAASKLILTNTEKVKIIEDTIDVNDECITDDVKDYFDFRQCIFDILQDRELTIDERIVELLSTFDIKLPEKTFKENVDIYLELEHLDLSWVDKINKLKTISTIDNDVFLNNEWSIAFEQLLVYFIYRHLADGLYDDRINERICFAVISYYIIRALCVSHLQQSGEVTINDLIEISRLYSSEIEYSEENIEAILEMFENK